MKKFLFLIFIVCLLNGAGLLRAQTEDWGIVSQEFYNRYYDRSVNLNFQITDPAAIAMGGAYVAIADNPHATLLNPAGLAQIQHPQVNFVTQFDFNTRDYTAAMNSGIKVLSTPKPIFTYPAFAGVFPFKFGSRRIALGLSYSTLANLRAKLEETQFFYGGGRINENKDILGGVKTIAGAVSVEVFPQIAVGVSFQQLFGTNQYDLKIQSPYADQRVYFRFNDEEKASGSLLTFGILLKPFKWISLGATAAPQWTYTVEENLEKIQIANYDSDVGWKTRYYQTPDDSLTLIKTRVPLSYRLGVTLQPLAKLKLSAGVEMINWSQAEITNNDQTQLNVLGDVQQQHFGIEYRFGTPDLQVPLRFGYYTNDFPQKDQFFEEKYYGEQIKLNYWTGGFGVVLSRLQFDFAFRQGTSEIGWWMRAADYYNERLFYTNDHFNQAMLSMTYKL
jgi:hypothetical protein